MLCWLSPEESVNRPVAMIRTSNNCFADDHDEEKWKFDGSIFPRHDLTLRILRNEVFSGVVDTGLMVWVES